MASENGTFGQYDAVTESWGSYKERLECYLDFKGIQDDKMKVAYLIASVGPQTYDILKSLTAPQLPKQKSFSELCDLLQTYLDPQPTLMMQRYKFYTMSQAKDEKTADFVAKLRRQAAKCNFRADMLEEMLRDRFVVGIWKESVQKKLLAEAEIDFEKAVKIVIAWETSEADAATIQKRRPEDVLRVEEKGYGRLDNRKTCYACGRGGHFSRDCRAKMLTCNKCGKEGHLARVCRAPSRLQTQKRVARKPPLNVVSATVDEEEVLRDNEEDEEVLWPVYQLSVRPDRNPPWTYPFEINGTTVNLELDTGASVTVLQLEDWLKLKEKDELTPAKIKLRSFSGEVVEALGMAVVKVRSRAEDKVTALSVVVVNNGKSSLAGRPWLNALKLDWNRVKGRPVVLKSGSSGGYVKRVSGNGVSYQDQNALSQKGNKKLKQLLQTYSEIFATELGKLEGIKAGFKLKKGARPKFFNARPLPFAIREKVEQTLKKEVKEGILKPVDRSLWAAPIVPITKPNGDVRVCADFKVGLNPELEVDAHPLPRVEDILYKLNGGKIYTKLDMSRAYHQVELTDDSADLCVINTQLGLLKYTRLPFGVASAPAIFQRCMDGLFQGLSGVAWFLDDIVVTGTDEDEHLANLERVFRRLHEKKVKLGLPKCSFGKSEVVMVGHKLSKEGVRPVNTKVEALLKMKPPTDQKQLKSLLGIATYYSKYIPNFSTLCAPLYELLKKDKKWHWTDKCTEAFCAVKRHLADDKLLIHFDPALPIVLSCDASPYGVGAVISHKLPGGEEKPIAFASQLLNETQRRYSQLEKEAYAIIFGVKKFYMYLLGTKFTLETDHRPLCAIFKPNKSLPIFTINRLQRWAVTMMAFSYEIRYKPNCLHGNADALSRLPCDKPSQTEDRDAQEATAVVAELFGEYSWATTLEDMQKKPRPMS